MRGNYDQAEDYFRKAVRVNRDNVEARAGIWITMASAGRDEEAWNALFAYYGAGQQMNAEAVRVATLLTMSRHYEPAAKLYDRLMEAAARPEVLQKVARLMRKTAKLKRTSYTTFYDNSSPEGLAQTLIIATLMGDTNRIFRCLSPAVNRDQARASILRQASLFGAITAKLDPNFFSDIVLGAFEVTKRTLDNGDVEVKLDASKSGASAFSSYSSVATLQVQPAGDGWQAITLDDPELDCATFATLALQALDHGGTARAVAWQTRLAELACRPRSAGGHTGPPLAQHLQEIAFTNDVLRVKAWAGIGLVGSQGRADVTRGASCLEEVVAAYPDEPLIKMALSYAESRLANLRKAAAILDTVDVSKLAAPDQLDQLAKLELSLEKLDGGDKAIARLREVAPDDEHLLWLQAFELSYRGKYTEATTALARLRERTKFDNRLYVSDECRTIALSGNKAGLRDFLELWREPDKPIAVSRPSLSHSCLAFGLTEQASEQIATMLAEGGVNPEALICYAEVALARGDTAEARHLASVADRLTQRSVDSSQLKSLALVHLGLGDYPPAAQLYREEGTTSLSHYSGYSLCMSALASRLAGDTPTAAQTLKVAATMQGDSDWPRLAIQYLSGTISEAEFRRAPERTTSTPLMRASRQCEVNCMLGLQKESLHDLPGALAAYRASVDTKSVTDLEYFIARLALLRLHDIQPTAGEDERTANRSASSRL